MWFGWTVVTWEVIFLCVTIAAAIFSGIGISAAFFSAIIGFKISDVVTREANDRIVKANVDIAEATARALEAQAALEKFKAPRALTPEQQQRITSLVRQFAGQEWAASISSVPDAMSFLASLNTTLKEAGWVRVPPLGDVITADGQASIAVVESPGVRVQVAPSRQSDLGLVANVLAATIQSEGIFAEPAMSLDIEKRPTAIQIIIGYKPQ